MPAGAYDIIKYVRGDAFQYDPKIIATRPETAIEVQGNIITARRGPRGLDYLAQPTENALTTQLRNMPTSTGASYGRWCIKRRPTKRLPEIGRYLRQIIELDVHDGKDVIEYLDN